MAVLKYLDTINLDYACIWVRRQSLAELSVLLSRNICFTHLVFIKGTQRGVDYVPIAGLQHFPSKYHIRLFEDLTFLRYLSQYLYGQTYLWSTSGIRFLGLHPNKERVLSRIRLSALGYC